MRYSIYYLIISVYLVTSDVIFWWFDDYDGTYKFGVYTHEFVCDCYTIVLTIF